MLKGTIPLQLLKKTVAANTKKDGQSATFNAQAELDMAKVQKVFGEGFAEVAYAQKMDVDIGQGETQVQYGAALGQLEDEYRGGPQGAPHELVYTVNKEKKLRFHARVRVEAGIAGITGTDRITIPLRLVVDDREARKVLEDYVGGKKGKAIRVAFRPMDKDEVEPQLPLRTTPPEPPSPGLAA